MTRTMVFKENTAHTIDPILINQMEDIVQEIVVQKKFQSDFYMNDLKSMESCNTFAWYVYDCGTHFIPLHDMNEVRSFQREWVTNLKDLKETKKGKKGRDIYRLYVCNTSSGELKRVYGFEEVNLVEHLRQVV